MGTKANPAPFDCYAFAAAAEPMFVLLARDKHAPYLVQVWADIREREGEDPKRVEDARACAEAMKVWRRNRKEPA